MDVALWIALVGALLGSSNTDFVNPAKGGHLGSRQILTAAAGVGALGVATAGVVAYGLYVKFGQSSGDTSVFSLPSLPRLPGEAPTDQAPNAQPAPSSSTQNAPSTSNTLLTPVPAPAATPQAPPPGPAVSADPSSTPMGNPPPWDAPLSGDAQEQPAR